MYLFACSFLKLCRTLSYRGFFHGYFMLFWLRRQRYRTCSRSWDLNWRWRRICWLCGRTEFTLSNYFKNHDVLAWFLAHAGPVFVSPSCERNLLSWSSGIFLFEVLIKNSFFLWVEGFVVFFSRLKMKETVWVSSWCLDSPRFLFEMYRMTLFSLYTIFFWGDSKAKLRLDFRQGEFYVIYHIHKGCNRQHLPDAAKNCAKWKKLTVKLYKR